MGRLPDFEIERETWTPNGSRIDPDRLQVECGPANQRHERLVVASAYGKTHRDTFDTDNAYRRQKFRERFEAMFGVDDGQLHEALEQAITDAADAADERDEQRQPLEISSFADLRDRNNKLHPPVIDGLLREGETCNIIADSKVGKSWLVYGLALSTITGRKWLERFETQQGKVLLIDNELHRSTLAHRIPAVANAMNIGASEYEHDLEVVSLRGRLRSLIDLAADLEVVEPHTYRAIILDAKYRFVTAGQSENDNAAETLFYNVIDQIAEKTRAAVVLIHHASKGSQSDKKVTDVGSGAGAQSRATDCHLIMRPHEEPGIVVVEAAVRSFKPVEPLAIRWQFPLWLPEHEADTSKLKGRLSPKQQQRSAADQEDTSKILTALVGEPMTSTALGRATGVSRERRQRLLDQLCSQGQVTAEETIKRGNPCYVYQLAN